jgi:metal-responsive CopG/Arc/MetJ family transcriptional regulator
MNNTSRETSVIFRNKQKGVLVRRRNGRERKEQDYGMNIIKVIKEKRRTYKKFLSTNKEEDKIELSSQKSNSQNKKCAENIGRFGRYLYLI